MRIAINATRNNCSRCAKPIFFNYGWVKKMNKGWLVYSTYSKIDTSIYSHRT